MTAKQIAEKRYVAKLSDEERERLNTLIRAGKHPARQLTKARILLKADASETGEGWRDCEIAAALDTSVDTVARTRQQLVEEGFDAVLVRKHSPASARARIFDGAAEAKLIALACSKPPKGRKAVDVATAGRPRLVRGSVVSGSWLDAVCGVRLVSRFGAARAQPSRVTAGSAAPPVANNSTNAAPAC